MKPLTRRAFLLAGAVAAAGALGGPLIAQGWNAWWLAPARRRYARLQTLPRLSNAPPGPLSGAARATLTAAATALLELPVEPTHYGEHFAWLAEKRPGYRALFEEFAAFLDGATERARRAPFAQCAEEDRRELLQELVTERLPANRWKRLRGFFNANFELIQLADAHVFGPVFTVFAATDVWVLLGYEGWPATPRGLERYTLPPPGAATARLWGSG